MIFHRFHLVPQPRADPAALASSRWLHSAGAAAPAAPPPAAKSGSFGNKKNKNIINEKTIIKTNWFKTIIKTIFSSQLKSWKVNKVIKSQQEKLGTLKNEPKKNSKHEV